MHRVLLVINTDKPTAIEAGRQLIAWLEARSFLPLLPTEGARCVGRLDLAIPEGVGWGDPDIVIVLGGDGTLIRAAQAVASLGVPVLGVNTGHLGFLTELEADDLFIHLEEILAGQFQVEERLMLNARVERGGQQLFEVTALNDVVVSKGPRARLVHVGVSAGETTVARYPADGVIVATPTGSTAYSLSAGGPIVVPTVDVVLVTPICPHSMNSRAMVFSGSEQITVTVLDCLGEVGISADGNIPFPLSMGDQVRIVRSPHAARLVRRHTYRFYDVLRQKLANPGR